MRRGGLVLVAVVWALHAAGCVKPPAPSHAKTPRRAATPQPPSAARNAIVHELHGDKRVDEYDWLRDRDSEEVLGYLQSEQAYAQAMLEPTRTLQAKLLTEFRSRAPAGQALPNVRRRGYDYYVRMVEGKTYPIYCRKRNAPGAAEEVLIDLNRLATPDGYVDLGSYEVSDDGKLLAYTLDTEGERSYTLFVKDLGSGAMSSEHIRDVGSFTWAADHTLFYTVEDASNRPCRVYRHTVGESSDGLVRSETDLRFSLDVARSRSKAYVFIESKSNTTTEVAFIPAQRPSVAPELVARRRDKHEYYVEHRGGVFVIRTNDRSPNFRIVSTPVTAPGESNWRELRPASGQVAIEEFAVFRDYLALHEREGGLPHLRILELHPLASGAEATAAPPAVTANYRIDMPEPVYDVHPEDNPGFDAPAYRFSYESLTSPTTYYQYRVHGHQLEFLERPTAPAGYDPGRYREERLLAKAADGTEIPISLVYKRDKAARPRPLLLEVYGAFGYRFPTTFSASRISLLDRGFIYAIAHVRGGGELGEAWHEAGSHLKKQTGIDDFVASAQHLIALGYTMPDRLAVAGKSAGGLIVAAALNDHPELFRAALLDVPVVDVLDALAEPGDAALDAEYDEWGNPQRAQDYHYLKSYCPYTNIQQAEYPALLVRASFDDSDVLYWQAAKYVARLRARAQSHRPILFLIDFGLAEDDENAEGDAEATESIDLKARAVDEAFLLTQVSATAGVTAAGNAQRSNAGGRSR